MTTLVMRSSRCWRPASIGLALGCLLIGGCSGNGRYPGDPGQGGDLRDSPRSGVSVVILGTAQDAGLPQLGAQHAHDVRARRDPGFKRLAASIAIVDHGAQKRWLVDCTPDIREQAAFVDEFCGGPLNPSQPGRPPLFNAIFLTHGHMGHYGGLIHFGRESYAATGQVVMAGPRMADLIRTQAPWELMVRLKHLEVKTLTADERIQLGPALWLTPISVPHRAEYTGTFAFLIEGPNRSLIYIPDIDKWEAWSQKLEDVLHKVDIALIDGTFFGPQEIPGRSMKEIPHPFIVETMERLRGLPSDQREKVWFTHLNHTNPVADPESEPSRELRSAGHQVAEDRQVLSL